MSGVRGSVTPTGKRTAGFDYPLTGQQQLQHSALQQQSATLSTPIHIQPRASPRPSSTTSNAGIVAQSCPTFGFAPPPAPSARPRLPSVDPPSLELPPSPPVFSPMQQEAVKGKKEESTSVALKKQIYSRSLSNYSSSAPANGGIDYLSKFAPNFGSVDEAIDDSDEEEEQTSNYRPSARAVSTRADADDDSPSIDGSSQAAGGRPIGIGFNAKSGSNAQNIARVQQVASGDDFSLSKSPTIFSIMSTSQHNAGLHTAATSTSSSTSPAHSLLNSIAAGAEPKQQARRSLINNKPPNANSPEAAQEDDLQFSISLDEQDGEAEDAGNSNQDPLPLY